MRKAIATMFALMVIAIPLPNQFSANSITTAEVPYKNLDNLSVVELIEHYSAIYGQDPALMKKVAECESKYNIKALGDSGRAFSVFQFHKGTFNNWSKEKGEKLDYKSYHDHIKLAVWAFSKGESYRGHWTSYVAITKGGKYSFYSKLLKKHFTVHCKLVK